MTRDYELGFILNPEAGEEETRGILNRVEQIVANHNGQIVRVQQWGRRRLAYPIQHHRDGFYVFIDMILTPETVSELERNLKVSEIVLRYMTRRRDPKAVQQEREARANAATSAANAAAAPVAAPASTVNEESGQLAPSEAQATPEVQELQPAPVDEEPQEVQAQESEQAQPVGEQAATPEEGAVSVPATSDTSETIEA